MATHSVGEVLVVLLQVSSEYCYLLCAQCFVASSRASGWHHAQSDYGKNYKYTGGHTAGSPGCRCNRLLPAVRVRNRRAGLCSDEHLREAGTA